MAPDIANRVSAALQRQVGGIDATRDLAAGARLELRRQRVRRRVAVAAVAVLAAVAVPVGMRLERSDGAWVVPVTTPAPRVTRPDIDPGHPPRVSVRLDKLNLGKPPRVPWYQDGMIHDGDHETALGQRLRQGSFFWFTPVRDGYVITTNERYSTLIGTDGTVRLRVPQPWPHAISADGSRLAWGELNGANSTRLVMADTTTGRVLHHLDLPTRVDVVGFVDTDRVLVDTGDRRDRFVVWNPDTGRTTPVTRFNSDRTVYAQGTTDGRRVLVLDEPEPDVAAGTKLPRLCTTGFDAGRGFAPVWKRCDVYAMRASRVSPVSLAIPWKGGNDRLVVNARTGRTELVVRNSTLGDPVAEPRGDLLFVAFEGKRQAIVRCSLDGRCELATRPATRDRRAPELPGF